MTATATHPGVVTYPGTGGLGVRGTLIAVPLCEGEVIYLDDGLTLGPATAETDASGTLQGGGIKVPIISGLLWDLIFEPRDNDLAKVRLGTFNLNTSGVAIEDLGGATVPHVISETEWIDIAAAIALGATNDSIIAGLAATGGTATKALFDARVQVTEAPLYPFRAAAYNGTNAKAAVDAAILAASQSSSTSKSVWIPNISGGILSDAPTLQSGVKLVGERGAVLKMKTAAARFLNLIGLTDVTMEGFTVDFDGKPTTAGIAAGAGTSKVFLRRVKLITSTAMATGVYGLDAVDGATELYAEHLDLDGLDNNVRIYKGAQRVHLYRPRIHNWRNRGITILGDATAASRFVTIEEMDIYDFDSANGGAQRQPVAVQGAAGAMHQDLTFRGGRIVGNGLPHHVGTDGGTLLGGTADALSLQFCRDFAVLGTEVIDGGEIGILASWGSNGGVISQVRAIGNNTVGVCLEGGNGAVFDIGVTDNLLKNNGKEQGSTVPFGGSGTPRQGTKNQLWCKFASGGIVIDGNTLVGPSDTNGFYLKDNTGEVKIGVNTHNGTVGMIDPASTNNTGTGLRFSPQPREARKTADQAVSSATTGTTLVNVTDLVLSVEAAGVYDLTSFIIYSTNLVVTEELKTHWVAPTASALVWTPNGPASTATGSATTTTAQNRSVMALTSDGTNGGFTGATNAVTRPEGVLTVGATAGTLQLQFAQSVGSTDSVTIYAGSWIRLTRKG